MIPRRACEGQWRSARHGGRSRCDRLRLLDGRARLADCHATIAPWAGAAPIGARCSNCSANRLVQLHFARGARHLATGAKTTTPATGWMGAVVLRRPSAGCAALAFLMARSGQDPGKIRARSRERPGQDRAPRTTLADIGTSRLPALRGILTATDRGACRRPSACPANVNDTLKPYLSSASPWLPHDQGPEGARSRCQGAQLGS